MNPLLIKGLIFLALIAGAYVKGCSDEKGRFDEHLAVDEAINKAQVEWVTARVAASKATKQEVDNAYRARLKELNSDNAALLDRMRLDLSAKPIVSTLPGTAGSSNDTSCFNTTSLNERIRDALGKALAGTLGVLQRGESEYLILDACATWALKEYKERR